MHKRFRPKYRVGDILEEWYTRSNRINIFLVVDIEFSICDCGYCQRGKPSKGFRWLYVLKNLQNGQIDEIGQRTIDMIPIFGRQPRHFMGWRKIG
jgi:hypothetical protein